MLQGGRGSWGLKVAEKARHGISEEEEQERNNEERGC